MPDARQTRRFRVRRDLRAEPQLYAGEPCFILKDPLSLAYFRFTPAQYALLELVDGRTLPEICELAARRFGAAAPDREAIGRMLAQLAASGLIAHDGAGQGGALFERASAQASIRRRALLGSLLYIRLPGIDPEPVLKRLHPWLTWVYSPAGVLAAVLLMLSAGGYTLVHLDQFLVRIRQESLEQFLSVQTIFWLWLALGLSKIVHEFGHGLTCRHFGGECHEMGLLFLVFSPCLYCDASDAWTMPGKWRRIAVSAAGIYVELVIASLAALVWWHTSAGVLHNIAFALMTLCSLNTLLVNANPLLRFDGYYILSDLLEVPNLRLKAQQALQSFVDRRLLGMAGPGPDLVATGGRRWPFITYAVTSWLYKWVLCLGIVWFFYTVLKPYRLGSVSVLLAAVVAAQLLVLPLWSTARRVWSARRQPGGVRRGPALVTGGIALGLMLAALWIPVPRRVTAPLVLVGRDQRSVQVPTAGRVESIEVRDGERVQEGDVLARLSDPALELRAAWLAAEVRRLDASAGMHAALEQPAEAEAARALRQRAAEELAARERQRSLLTVRAPVNGRVVFADRRVRHAGERQGYRELSTWEETPLAAQNVGARWDAGERLCDLLPREEFEAVLYVEQSELPFVEVGQTVRVQLDAFPARTLEGVVRDIAQRESEAVPAALLSTSGGELPARLEETGGATAAVRCYEVRVALAARDGQAWRAASGALHSRGRGKIHCGTWTCYEWARRELAKLWAL